MALGDRLEHCPEVSERLDVIKLAGLEEAGNAGPGLGACLFHVIRPVTTTRWPLNPETTHRSLPATITGKSIRPGRRLVNLDVALTPASLQQTVECVAQLVMPATTHEAIGKRWQLGGPWA